MLSEARLPRGQWDSNASFLLGSLGGSAGAVRGRTTFALCGLSRPWRWNEIWVCSLSALEYLLSAWKLIGIV